MKGFYEGIIEPGCAHREVEKGEKQAQGRCKRYPFFFPVHDSSLQPKPGKSCWVYVSLTESIIERVLLSYGLHLRPGIEFEHVLDTVEKVRYTAYSQIVEYLQAPFFVLKDTGIFKDGKMPGNSGDIRTDHFSELADTSFSSGQLIDNEKVGGMSQGFQDSGPEFKFSLDFRIHFIPPLNGYLVI